MKTMSLIAALALTLPVAAHAQSTASNARGGDGGAPAVPPVPYGPGEKLGYEVRLGLFGNVGDAYMEVLPLEEVRGRHTYPMVFRLKGGVMFAKVDSRLQSWMDVSALHALRFKQDQKEVNFERHRVTDFHPERGEWSRPDGSSGPLAAESPLDDVSFLYYVRTLPLEVGKTYTFNRYYKDDGNPVVVKVLRRELIETPAGKFNTLVVQPVIKTDGLFGEGGEALVYFTDDNRRLLVQMKSKVPVIGSLQLKLTSYRPGKRVLASDLQ